MPSFFIYHYHIKISITSLSIIIQQGLVDEFRSCSVMDHLMSKYFLALNSTFIFLPSNCFFGSCIWGSHWSVRCHAAWQSPALVDWCYRLLHGTSIMGRGSGCCLHIVRHFVCVFPVCIVTQEEGFLYLISFRPHQINCFVVWGIFEMFWSSSQISAWGPNSWKTCRGLVPLQSTDGGGRDLLSTIVCNCDV